MVLPREFGPGGDAIRSLPILLSDASLEAPLMLDGKRSICIFGQDQAPNTKGIFFARVGVPVPLIEITELTGMRTRCLQWRLPWHLEPILCIQGRHLCLHLDRTSYSSVGQILPVTHFPHLQTYSAIYKQCVRNGSR